VIAGECRVCGCTEDQACVFFKGKRLSDVELYVLSRKIDIVAHPDSSACTWIEPDLCSGCVEEPAPPPLLYDAEGRPLRGAP